MVFPWKRQGIVLTAPLTHEVDDVVKFIDEFLATLDKENRIMFVRRYWHSDSIDDLAKLFHTSNHNISVRLSRTREKLKKHLIKEGVSL